MKEDTITLAVLGERVNNLKEMLASQGKDIVRIRRDVRSLLWKVALIAGALGGGAGFAGGVLGQ